MSAARTSTASSANVHARAHGRGGDHEADGEQHYAATLQALLSLSEISGGSPLPPREGRMERMRALLNALGNPDGRAAVVHIAGTNGKGSTAALIAAAASAGGFRVGLFTSPHLHSMRERIRTGLEPIAAADFVTAFEAVRYAAKQVERAGLGTPSTLETLTAMAFHHFARVDAQLQVIEAFVGGRTDITNVVQPNLCVITNISLDHAEALGGSLAAIASAKAGILKPGVAVVIGPQRREALQVILSEADRQHARRHYVPSWKVAAHARCPPTTSLENQAVAATVLHELARHGFPIARDVRNQAWRQLQWPARGEWIGTATIAVVADGAHCGWAMQRLVRELRRAGRNRDAYVVFGGQVGHDVRETASELLRLQPQRLLLTASRHPRAIPVAELARRLAGLNGAIEGGAEVAPSVAAALETARALAKSGDLVVVTGSLAVAAEAREALLPRLVMDPRGTPAGRSA